MAKFVDAYGDADWERDFDQSCPPIEYTRAQQIERRRACLDVLKKLDGKVTPRKGDIDYAGWAKKPKHHKGVLQTDLFGVVAHAPEGYGYD